MSLSENQEQSFLVCIFYLCLLYETTGKLDKHRLVKFFRRKVKRTRKLSKTAGNSPLPPPVLYTVAKNRTCQSQDRFTRLYLLEKRVVMQLIYLMISNPVHLKYVLILDKMNVNLLIQYIIKNYISKNKKY